MARGRPGQPDDTAQLKQQITQLTQRNHQLKAGLAGRDQDLAAARAANRELIARLNTRDQAAPQGGAETQLPAVTSDVRRSDNQRRWRSAGASRAIPAGASPG
jgi:hypothetical protein